MARSRFSPTNRALIAEKLSVLKRIKWIGTANAIGWRVGSNVGSAGDLSIMLFDLARQRGSLVSSALNDQIL
jgi:hypothetical protein